MPSYQLHYFQSRGLAEVARQIFYIGKIEYEDVRIPKSEWPAKKSNYPNEQVPALYVDGVEISQSHAIWRFLAKRTGLYGKDEIEQALVDSAADLFKDHYLATLQYFIYGLKIYETSEEEVERLKTEVMTPSKDRFFRALTKILEKSKTGFIAGGGLTFVDLAIAEYVSTILKAFPEVAVGYPLVEALLKKIHALPELKGWLETRPKTDY